MRRPVRIDKDELDQLAEVEFDWADVAELVALATYYHERFRGPQLPDFMLDDAARQAAATTELQARRAFVEAVEGIWRKRHHKKEGVGASYRTVIRKRIHLKQEHDGPMLRLLLALLAATGESVPRATLYHDLNFLRSGREREHKS